MISQTSVIMATPIALIATEKNIDLHENVSDVIKGLNETTASVQSFTPDNIAVDLPDYTGHIVEHTEAAEVSSTIIADRIRNSLEAISKYVKPALKEATNNISWALSGRNATEFIFSNLRVNMVNIEPEIFRTSFFPKQKAEMFTTNSKINVKSLLTGSYPSMTGEQLRDLIYVDIPVLQPFFSDLSLIKDVYDSIFVEKYWYNLFDYNSIKEDLLDVLDTRNYSFTNLPKLVIVTLLVNRLSAMDDPLQGVTGVSLEQYRLGIKMAKETFNTILFLHKDVWERRATAGIVVMEDSVEFTTDKKDDDFLGDVAMLRGELTIGYNNAILQMFADGDSISLSEYVIGFVYCSKTGIRVRDIITDKETVVDGFNQYRAKIIAELTNHQAKIASTKFKDTINGLYAKDGFKELIDSLCPDNSPMASGYLINKICEKVDLKGFFSDRVLMDKLINNECTLMQTVLAAILSDAMGFVLSAEILRMNATSNPGDIEHQKKTLAKSINVLIVKHLMKR